ncbi:MAG: hypothetical protein J6Y85_02720 [Alphaproteobacteria bacterium]|nr:hypothetical protein [Alphaproteobacteria bacterium]
MKKGLAVLLCCFVVLACRKQTPVFIDVERATLYHGQSAVSLYDNFGAPQKHYMDPYGIHEVYYKFEDIQQRNLKKKYYFCDLAVYLDDDVVIDWQWRGNKCHVEVDEKEFYLDED